MPREMQLRFLHWCQTLKSEVPSRGRTGDLSIGAQQSIEMMRALEREARVIVMDEPTAALAPREREALFERRFNCCRGVVSRSFISLIISMRSFLYVTGSPSCEMVKPSSAVTLAA